MKRIESLFATARLLGSEQRAIGVVRFLDHLAILNEILAVGVALVGWVARRIGVQTDERADDRSGDAHHGAFGDLDAAAIDDVDVLADQSMFAHVSRLMFAL